MLDPEITCCLGVREDDLYRMLRLLVNHGYFEALPAKDEQPVRFRNNALSATLRSDHPNSIKAMVRAHVP